ncbi:tetratricopeptide repeat protein [Candidatus Albibeggiatoa sp. nov. NOAA]|uniref:tetratricopeptide repeat protein n=1 Tax=Candidatus Albibeggiatoa sp. nov. NOAA TaxID=3162724 RepID=UPI0032FB410E|nr:tetratricopeptide repeat protein [Thiotrichaceae bacterium]
MQWTDEFGLFFVQCSPAQGKQIYTRLTKDLLHEKQGHLLVLDKEIDDLYPELAALDKIQDLDMVFILGLEKSFERYIGAGYGGQGDYYREDSVPRVLGCLNLEREKLRDSFPNLSLVFLLPRFGMKYFIRRAKDCFDWQAGVFHFSTEKPLLEKQVSELLKDTDFEHYKTLDNKERINQIVEMRACLDELDQNDERYAELLSKLGGVHLSKHQLEFAAEYYEQVTIINPNNIKAWDIYGSSLHVLGRYEEAIASFEKALEIDSHYKQAWFNKGNVLDDLDLYNEAITCYKTALIIAPKDAHIWNALGNSLKNLNKHEEAIASYNKALEIKSNYKYAWGNKGNVLRSLKMYEEAIICYDKVLEIDPNDTNAPFNKFIANCQSGKLGEQLQFITTFPESIEPIINIAKKKIKGVFYQSLQNISLLFSSFDTEKLLDSLISSSKNSIVLRLFNTWLTNPTTDWQPILNAIEILEANNYKTDWHLRIISTKLEKLTPAQRNLANTFIHFFENKITLQELRMCLGVDTLEKYNDIAINE